LHWLAGWRPIERDAEALLAEYARAKNVEIKAPIPIEDIVEKHLKLHVEFDDLHRLLEVPRGGIRVGEVGFLPRFQEEAAPLLSFISLSLASENCVIGASCPASQCISCEGGSF